MTLNRTCDGIRRRDFLRVGAIGATALTLSNFLRLSHAGEVKNAKATSAIFINLGGGRLRTWIRFFDPKPNAPLEYRGEFNPIKTNVPGIEICEHLPRLAEQMDKFCILRGVTHSLAAHELGSLYVNTGNRPIPSIEFPSYGAVVTKELGGAEDLPPFWQHRDRTPTGRIPGLFDTHRSRRPGSRKPESPTTCEASRCKTV